MRLPLVLAATVFAASAKPIISARGSGATACSAFFPAASTCAPPNVYMVSCKFAIDRGSTGLATSKG
jgi:hypothetical protein